MLKFVILFGGLSNEHAISCKSAAAILKNADPEKYQLLPVGITRDGRWFLYENPDLEKICDGTWEEEPTLRKASLSPNRDVHGLMIHRETGWEPLHVDVCFPVLHGFGGEDGTIQGLLTLSGIPFVGPRVAASANCMDKSLTKMLIARTGIRQAAYHLVFRYDHQKDPFQAAKETATALGHRYPMFVKPCSSGSSVGVARADDFNGLVAGLEEAFQWDNKVLVEEFIDGQEIECAVLGNHAPIASTVGEVEASQKFYTFEAKYCDTTSQLYIPARIPAQAMQQVQEHALRIYHALGCRGLSRVDFFYTGEEIVFNEINTIPGFTDISMYPKLFEWDGIPFSALIDRLVGLAMEEVDG